MFLKSNKEFEYKIEKIFQKVRNKPTKGIREERKEFQKDQRYRKNY